MEKTKMVSENVNYKRNDVIDAGRRVLRGFGVRGGEKGMLYL